MSNQNTSKIGTAVVTGASSGIGKVYAERLAERGYDLLLIARRADRLQAIAFDLQERSGIRVETLVADLAQPAGLSEAIQKIDADLSITLLVNNAGTFAAKPVTETSLETLTNMIALNITALTALTKAVLPRFQERNSGTIINIGSNVGFTGFSWVPIYGATKAYVLNFTQALQQQFAGTGVRIQLVTPGATVSEILQVSGTPMSNLDPETVMSTENCVDAALRGLDINELITAPSVQDDAVLSGFEAASTALFRATRHGQPAPRYGLDR